MKGISTIIALILIVVIVVALIGLVYTFAVSFFSTPQEDTGHWDCIQWDYKDLNCSCPSDSPVTALTVNKNITGEACGTVTVTSFGPCYYPYCDVNITTKQVQVYWDCKPNLYCTKQEWVRNVNPDGTPALMASGFLGGDPCAPSCLFGNHLCLHGC